MTPEKKATLIRTLFVVLVLGGGLLGGFFFKFPGLPKDKGEEPEVEQVTEENFAEIVNRDNQLTVMNMMLDGNPDSAKLQEILSNLDQEKYGDEVAFTEMKVSENEALARQQGVDPENFEGKLNFYAAGLRLGTLEGETDPEVVEKTIDRYLSGLVKRFGPEWLPDVQGMQRDTGQDVLTIQPAKPAPGQSPPAGSPAPPTGQGPPQQATPRPAEPGSPPPGMQPR